MLVSARAMSLHVRLKLKVDTDRFTEINQQLTLNIIAYVNIYLFFIKYTIYGKNAIWVEFLVAYNRIRGKT